ncbi:MAG: ComEC/Rec2 family competence protein, partial [Candidatus Margulisiibacteriota bacterium]
FSEPSVSGSKISFDLKETDSGKNIRVMIFSDKEKYQYGDQIKLKGKVIKSKTPGNPGEMDYDDYLKRKGISNSISVFPDKDGFPEVTAKNKGNWFISSSLTLKNKVIALHKNSMPEPYASLFGSIIFGMKGSPIPDEIKSRYQKSGVVHILVASGQQVSILIGVCLLAFSALRMPAAFILIITSFITWSFAAMAGFGASIVRSAIMGQIMIAGKIFDREGDFLNSLCLAALVLLVIDPYNLFDIGFQLSFLATWSLVYAAPLINEALQKHIPKFAAGSMSIAMAPVLATSPISAYNFSQLTPVAFLSNIIVVPMAEALTVFGFISTAAGLILPFLSYFLDGFIFALMYTLDLSVSCFSRLPGAYTYIEKPAFIWIIFYYAFLVYLMVKAKEGGLIACFRRWKYRIILFLTVFLCFNIISSFIIRPKPLLVTFIDVGQGDSILVETPDNRKILIDAGGKPYSGGGSDKIGSKIIVPFLHRKGINSLDLVVLTHPHDDHAGGMVPVLKEIKVDEVLDIGLPYESYTYKNFLRLVKRNKIK